MSRYERQGAAGGAVVLPQHAYPLLVERVRRRPGHWSVHWFADEAGFVEVVCEERADDRQRLEPIEVRIAPATDSSLDPKLMRFLDARKMLRMAERQLWGAEPVVPPRTYRKASEHRHREVMLVYSDGGVRAVRSMFDVSERTAYRWVAEAEAAGFGEGNQS